MRRSKAADGRGTGEVRLGNFGRCWFCLTTGAGFSTVNESPPLNGFTIKTEIKIG